jgi:phosphotriesterase-related protein
MTGGTAMTVLGPVPVSQLGAVDAHDHLFLRTPALPGHEFEDLEGSVAEVREAMRGGLGTIVEMTPVGCGRAPAKLRALSEATGLHVIAAAGYHRDAHYPAGHWIHDASEEMLAERVIRDLTVGMHPADWLDPSLPPDPARAGAIKAGASYHRITAGERLRLLAAGAGVRETGAAVLVHCEVGTCGHEIVDVLVDADVPPDRIVLAHLDRNPDPEVHREIASRGVWLEYDTPGRIKYRPDSQLIDLIGGLVADGFGGRLLLALDLGYASSFRSRGGGPGLGYLLGVFAPRLRRAIGDAATDAILVANPAAAFALAPVGVRAA